MEGKVGEMPSSTFSSQQPYERDSSLARAESVLQGIDGGDEWRDFLMTLVKLKLLEMDGQQYQQMITAMRTRPLQFNMELRSTALQEA